MSTFENNQFRWRETYFVLFPAGRRPKLKTLEKKLLNLHNRFTVTNAVGDDSGRFESITVLAPDDFAAVDVCYTDGEEVREQAASIVEDLRGEARGADRKRLDHLRVCDGRFEVLHFEQLSEDDQEDELLDPSTLLVVLEALSELTDGIAFDPQAGAIM